MIARNAEVNAAMLARNAEDNAELIAAAIRRACAGAAGPPPFTCPARRHI
jgi:hypothetical protein